MSWKWVTWAYGRIFMVREGVVGAEQRRTRWFVLCVDIRWELMVFELLDFLNLRL